MIFRFGNRAGLPTHDWSWLACLVLELACPPIPTMELACPPMIFRIFNRAGLPTHDFPDWQ
jgi:hypothetical protein